jgi:hypothetical protein
MANEVHLAELKRGVESWNQWRKESPEVKPDLSDANLSRANLEVPIAVEPTNKT